MEKQLNLPRVYNNESHPERKGRVYMSYSQYSSFNETGEFHYQMILQYIFGIKMESRFQAYADYGTHCGEYIETQGAKRGEMLSDADCKIMDGIMKNFSDKSEYEREIWIKRNGYHILGFIDRYEPLKENYCSIGDFKTGNEKKVEKYSGEDYGQTTLYSFAEEEKGALIKDSYVTLLVRTGNPNATYTEPTPFSLTGKVINIPTPYSKERANKVLKKMDETALKIASLKTTYDSLSQLTIKM